MGPNRRRKGTALPSSDQHMGDTVQNYEVRGPSPPAISAWLPIMHRGARRGTETKPPVAWYTISGEGTLTQSLHIHPYNYKYICALARPCTSEVNRYRYYPCTAEQPNDMGPPRPATGTQNAVIWLPVGSNITRVWYKKK